MIFIKKNNITNSISLKIFYFVFIPCLVFLPVFCRETSALEKTVYTLAAYPTNDPKKVFNAVKPLADHISSLVPQVNNPNAR